MTFYDNRSRSGCGMRSRFLFRDFSGRDSYGVEGGYTRKCMNIVLISTYELGRQPFGLASPAAWLRKRGHHVAQMDLTRQSLNAAAVQSAQLIALYLPMHTATRLAAQLLPTLRELNPAAHLCCYGLYAPMNERYLRTLGVETILGGEFEQALSQLAQQVADSTDGQIVEQQTSVSME